MGLEAATFIGQLVESNPNSTDQALQGDDHLRLIKSALKATFPNLTFAVTFSSFAVTYLDEDSATSACTALGAVALAGNNTLTGTLQLDFSDNGAGPQYRFDLRSASTSPANEDDLIEVRQIGLNDAGTPEDTTYASWGATIKNKADGVEAGAFYIKTALSGVVAKRVLVAAGLFSLNATDGDKGVDTANFVEYYRQGVKMLPDVAAAGKVFVSTGLTTQPALRGGFVRDLGSVELVAWTTCSTAIPNDDTIPQSNEGDEVLLLEVIPSEETSVLEIEVSIPVLNSTTVFGCAALFKDAGADALKARQFGSNSAAYPKTVHFKHREVAGSTSARTYKVRVGPASGSVYINGDSGGRNLGGVESAMMTVREIMPA